MRLPGVLQLLQLTQACLPLSPVHPCSRPSFSDCGPQLLNSCITTKLTCRLFWVEAASGGVAGVASPAAATSCSLSLAFTSAGSILSTAGPTL